MSAACNIREKIQLRAHSLSRARSFFEKRSILEVDCIALSKSASIDVNIDLFSLSSPLHGNLFLFSSPEYQMKRLLAQNSGDIYYLGHVWRHEEMGDRHSPEFMMAEWYRIGFSFKEMIEETIEFCSLFTKTRELLYLSYQEAFLTYAKIDPFTATDQELQEKCYNAYPISSRDEALNLILAREVEPYFPPKKITILYHYPASQAALAKKININNRSVAERFEIYCEGLELANGYHELTNMEEQRTRFQTDNKERVLQGKNPYPVDEQFLTALSFLPNCCGVAVGVDRLLMLQTKSSSLHSTHPISWNNT